MATVMELIAQRDEAAAARRDAEAARARADAETLVLIRLDRLRSRLARQDADARATVDAIVMAMTQIPAAQDALRATEQALVALEAQLKELNERIAKIEAEIELARQSGGGMLRRLLQQRRQLQQARVAAEAQREAADAARAQAAAQLAALQTRAAKLPAAEARAAKTAQALRELDDRRTQLGLSLPALRQQAMLLAASADALAAQFDFALQQLFGGLRTDVPIALLPVRIETRFRISTAGALPNELLIRIYPDDIHKDAHETALTAEEDRWGRHFWRETWRAGTAPVGGPTYGARRDQEIAAWRQLATRFGAARAAYVAARLTPTNGPARPASPAGDSPLAADPDFPGGVPNRASSWTRAAVARALPERWLATGSRAGAPDNSIWGELIPAVVATGPDPAAAAPAPGTTLPQVPVDPGMRWMVDFVEAERIGMGIRMPLTADDAVRGFDRLVVVGVRGASNDPAEGAAELRALLAAHRFTWGAAFVPLGIPTNNTEREDAGFSREDAGFERSFALEREQRVASLNPNADGALAARAIGLPPDEVARLQHAGGRNQRDASYINRALWPVTFGYFLDQILNNVVPGVDALAWREYFALHVRARGPLPSLRIGRQPYGLLPVTSLDRWVSSRPDLIEVLRALREVWRGCVASVARAGRSGDGGLDLIETLGLEAVSTRYSWRWARGPRFFDLFCQLPGQEIDRGTREIAMETLAERLRVTLQGLGLSEGQWTRLSRMTFAQIGFDWEGPLVQDGESSETQTLRHNYLERLVDPGVSLQEIHDEAVTLWPAGTPRPLLYQLLRHATLLAYAEQALPNWGAFPTTPTEAPWFEPELVDVVREEMGDRPGDPLRTPTFWRVLETVRSGAALSLGDDLRARGKSVPSPLQEFLGSVLQLAEVPTAALERLLGETLDLASHRLDAWITSLASSRLSEMRANQPEGVYLGGYGWVEDLRPRGSAPLSDGFVHAPSVAQATSAAVLRSGYLAHRDDAAGARLQIDLSSRRVRLAKGLLDGVRQGQPLGALLGYRFERALHDGPPQLNRFVAPLRELAPLAGGRLVPAAPGEPLDAIAADNVVDGLKLLDVDRRGGLSLSALGATPAEETTIREALATMSDAVDAIGDLALVESVHQAVQGNYARAGATLDAISRGETPADTLDAITTPRSGIAFTQRLVALFNTDAPPENGWSRERARAVAEPVLTAWAEQYLGSPARVRCQALFFDAGKDPLHGTPTAQQSLSLDALGLCALDVVYAPPIGETAQQSEIERRLARAAFARRPAGLPDDASVRLVFTRQPGVHAPEDLTVPQLFELARAARALITNARPLDARDLARVGTVGDSRTAPPDTALNDVMRRWERTKRALHALFDVSDPTALDVLHAAPFDVPTALLGPGVNLLELVRAANLPHPVDLAAAVAATGVPTLPQLDALRDALDAFGEFAVQNTVPASIAGAAPQARAELAEQAARVTAQVVRIDRTLDEITGTAARDSLAKLALLFGEGFVVLPSFTLAPQTDLASALERRSRAGDATALDVVTWLQAVALVREGARRFTAATTYADAVGTGGAMAFQVAQFPFDGTDRWNVPEGPALAGATSLVVYAPADLELTKPLAGLMLDEWVEVVPRPTLQTAVSFHYDAPGARAPQAVLLAVSPDPAQRWDAATLAAIVTETCELAKLRTVDYDALSGLGHLLPAIFLANNVGGDPAGDTVSSKIGA